jgi:Peptidase propeptide and YPEB domain
MKISALVLSLSLVVVGSAAAQKPTYARDVPAKLAARAKVSEADAVAAARKLLPHATVAALELEQENGRLIYSFDMKTAGKEGIDEVNIDAMSGKQVGKIRHESSADERKEAAAEKKAAGRKGGGGR